jgi:hypothetical protein
MSEKWTVNERFTVMGPDHKVIYVHDKQEVVAQCWLVGTDEGLPLPEQEKRTIANARLISAAPELAMVAGMLADVSEHTLDTMTHDQLKNMVRDIRQDARAAIAKAEGRVGR